MRQKHSPTDQLKPNSSLAEKCFCGVGSYQRYAYTQKFLSKCLHCWVAGLMGRKMVTRSRTGSLTPKLFADSIVSTTASVKMTSKANLLAMNQSTIPTSLGSSAADESVIVVNKNGDISRVTKSKSQSSSPAVSTSSGKQEIIFKLGTFCSN